MILGYAEQGPSDGIGPFKALFNSGINLRYASSLNSCQAIVLWGGADISPSLYGEDRWKNSGPTVPSERDVFEWGLIREAVKKEIPIIGVCRGAQMLCAYTGGKLIQDVNGHGNGYHNVKTYDGELFRTSTCHHQMMYPFDVEHELLGWAPDHLANVYNPPETEHAVDMEMRRQKEPEVVYFPQIKGFAIQGHPEWHHDAPGQLFNTWLMGQIKQKCFSKIQQEC